VPDPYDPARVAADLARCRQRGLEGLDRNTANQKPVDATELQRLAAAYAAATSSEDPRRIAQIKSLLIAGIEVLRQQDRQWDADLIRDLFFGEITDGPSMGPGELLKMARSRREVLSDYRFHELRDNTMMSFANVLIAHVRSLVNEAVAVNGYESPPQVATIGLADDTEHFVEMLAAAETATIIGITNEDLLPMLKEALRLKREASGRADAFWESLRIVFQSMDLLTTVNDERLRLSDTAEALRQRREAAIWARRLIAVFLKRTGSTNWEMREVGYQPVPTGTFLEFADGTKAARLLIRRPRHATQQQIYVEVPDPKGRVGGVFDEIVYSSDLDDEIVPVGQPVGEFAFRCNSSRVQSRALKDKQLADGWLPMVLIVTYSSRRGGQVEPIMQLRTIENSAREEHRLSHVSGHLLEADRLRPGGRELAHPPSTFDLTHEVPVGAAKRVFGEITGGLEPPAEPIPVTASAYLYPNIESLFFFVYALNVPEGLQYPKWAEMQPFGVDRLLAVRASQSYRAAADLCRKADISVPGWAVAARIASLNLILHGRGDLAERLAATARGATAERATLAHDLDGLVQEITAPSRASSSREVTVEGLAGWQYRHFFSDLLPLYAKIGVDEAAGLLESVSSDPIRTAALRELAEVYQDERTMAMLPMEL
jgi:hypothetical protein